MFKTTPLVKWPLVFKNLGWTLMYVLLEYSTQSRAPETFTGVRNSEQCLFSLTLKSFFCCAHTSTSNMRQEQGKKKQFLGQSKKCSQFVINQIVLCIPDFQKGTFLEHLVWKLL